MNVSAILGVSQVVSEGWKNRQAFTSYVDEMGIVLDGWS